MHAKNMAQTDGTFASARALERHVRSVMAPWLVLAGGDAMFRASWSARPASRASESDDDNTDPHLPKTTFRYIVHVSEPPSAADGKRRMNSFIFNFDVHDTVDSVNTVLGVVMEAIKSLCGGQRPVPARMFG